MKVAILALVVFVVLIGSPPVSEAQSPNDGQLIAVIAVVDAEIKSAESENAQFSAGLVKALIESRIHTLKQTRAMLDQRRMANTFNIALRYTIDGKVFEPPVSAAGEVNAIDVEIEKSRRQVATQEVEAARYSGGLVRALSLSTLATQRQTLAMLEQKRAAIHFQLPQFVGFVGAQAPSPVTAGQPLPDSSAPAAPVAQIVHTCLDGFVANRRLKV